MCSCKRKRGRFTGFSANSTVLKETQGRKEITALLPRFLYLKLIEV